ncbi:acyl-CoA thioesterase [Alkalicoccus urumqiensis]|uniref:Uncharacterized protein n=1 Tax=Alkalicoccus urumqiensis TaxID=1548213 RepID=A0A2P6MFA8_ALKUR|nr:thioesterase family protein [Alkalicoccus urumqiensis]PRO64937.1 hypothetical protein C6I21_12400 [Alkalicoccus urumqiensis]
MGVPAYIQHQEDWFNGFTFFDTIQVRFSETDAFGHVNNTVSFVYFEQARIHYFQSLGIMDEWMKGQSIIVTGDLQCDYIRQVTFGETLAVGVKVEQLGRTSLDLHYVILNEEEKICMTGRGRIVHVHKKSGKPEPWTESMKEMLTDAGIAQRP